MMKNFKTKLNNLPQSPGVYQFLDKNGRVLYIGKAKNLRARVRQYFAGDDERPQIPFLMKEAADFSYTIVNNELESLYLENTLIKEHCPKYNIELKDDKSYAFIVIDYSTEIPQITIRRRPNENNSKIPPFVKTLEGRQNSNDKSNPKTQYLKPDICFGPYTSAKKIRDLIFTIRKIFGLCAAKKIDKPCFYFHLHRCPGVCVGKISLKDYYGHLEIIKTFLSGKINIAAKKIEQEMLRAAKQKKFEAATRLRDQLKALSMLEQKQNMILTKKVNWDMVSYFSGSGYGCVNLFKIREGKLVDKENFVYETKTGQTNIAENFLENYYLETSDAPKEIFLQEKTENQQEIIELVKHRFNKKIKISIPQKGKTRQLVKLGTANAEEYLKRWLSDKAVQLDKINSGLNELKSVFQLPAIPKRIEGYDISNIQGTNAVGSMVVFEDGLPAKSQYRKFKIRTKDTPDDYAMMQEMLTRRLLRSHADKFQNPNDKLQTNFKIRNQNPKLWKLPNLIVIDGGRGQLNAAIAVLKAKSYKLNAIPVIGLAKRIEEISIPGRKQPILLPHDNPALQLLQRLRDEAHRFGLAFHQNLRSKQAVKSALDDILGVGPKTKKLLKTKFGTVANVREASLDELINVVGEKLARVIKQQL